MTPNTNTERMRVLVTGAAGVMGRHLVSGLLARGYLVRGLVLPGEPRQAELQATGCEVVEGNIAEANTLRGVADDVHTVYHLAAVLLARDASLFSRVNREGTRNVVHEAVRAGVHHFIHVSSASVTYPHPTPYALSKREGEEIVRNCSQFAHTIVRPTLVYDFQGGIEFEIFRRALELFPIIPVVGDGRVRKRPVWAEDVVQGLLSIVGQPIAYSKVYNLSGAESISMRELARLIVRTSADSRRSRSRRLAGRRPTVSVPVPLCRLAARICENWFPQIPLTQSAISGMVQGADLDPTLAMQEIGYRPLGVHDGFAHCFAPTPSS